MPPAPRSLKPHGSRRSRTIRNASYVAAFSTRFRNGSGSCTAPRESDVPGSPSSPEANAAPPKPLSSVGLPTRTNAHGPGPSGTRLRSTPSAGANPIAIAFTRQLRS